MLVKEAKPTNGQAYPLLWQETELTLMMFLSTNVSFNFTILEFPSLEQNSCRP